MRALHGALGFADQIVAWPPAQSVAAEPDGHFIAVGSRLEQLHAAATAGAGHAFVEARHQRLAGARLAIKGWVCRAT